MPMLKRKKRQGVIASSRVKTYRKTSIRGSKGGMSFFTRKKKKLARKNVQTTLRHDAFIHYGYYVLLIMFFTALIYIFLFSPYVRITTINLFGVEDIPAEDILMATDEYMSGSYFFVFPKRSYTLFDEQSYSKYMKEKFPKIRLLTVDRKFPSSIQLHVTERDALMLWCSDSICYMLDELGQAYEKEENIVYAPSLTRIRIFDQSNQAVALGSRLVPDELIRLFTQFYGGFHRIMGIELEEEFLIKGNIAQEIEAKTHEGWTIKLNTNLEAQQSLRMLKTFFEKEFILKEDREKLDYVDVRIENKIFYKLKDEYLEKDNEGEASLNQEEDVIEQEE